MAEKTKKNRKTLRTGVGIACFPHIFKETVSDNDKGEDVYEVMILIDKEDTATVKAISDAAKEIAKAEFEDAWEDANLPLRDGDKEKNLRAEDGTKRGEKYPERLGKYFFTARSKRPIPVFDKNGDIITDPSAVYAGSKIILNVDLYPYEMKGNMGVGVGLNGVMKVADGEPLTAAGGEKTADALFGDVDVSAFADADEKPKKKGKKKKG